MIDLDDMVLFAEAYANLSRGARGGLKKILSGRFVPMTTQDFKAIKSLSASLPRDLRRELQDWIAEYESDWGDGDY